MDFGHLEVSSQEIFLTIKLISNVNSNWKIRGNNIFSFKIIKIIKNFLYINFYFLKFSLIFLLFFLHILCILLFIFLPNTTLNVNSSKSM